MKRLIFIFLSVVLAFGVTLPAATPVSAGIEYDPTSETVSVEAGSSSSFPLTLNYLVVGEEYTGFLSGSGPNKVQDSWVILPSFTAESTSKTLTITVHPPPGTAAGTYTSKIKYLSSASGCDLTVIVTAGDPDSIVVTPTGEQNTVGDPHIFTATVKDGEGNPLEGISVTWSIQSGPGSLDNITTTTNASGQTTNTLNSTEPGTTTVRAAWTDDAGVNGEATKIWVVGDPDSIVVTPTGEQNTVGDPHIFTAT
ncbi:MAG TPA: hypothetical protein G4O19_04290, partial [Dehalococcoidia bacterium]|nr:hypothetical protein [Dehalococcoidia bacterium]